jgi:alanyl-tRNA synthetase
VHDRIAHTAEHAFIGSLQKLLGQTLRVRKVEHRESSNTAFIVIPHLDPDIIFKAQSQVNSLIKDGRKVIVHTFDSLEEAKKAIPSLRANEERISGQVRVVEIEGHDFAACAMDHAENLSECDFFLVSRISKSGTEYELDFVVGGQAKEMASFLAAKLHRVCDELGANINTVENTARNLAAENEKNRSRANALGIEMLRGIRPVAIGRFHVFRGTFSHIADDQLQEFAGKKIKEENALIMLANTDSEPARIVLARNEKDSTVDCNALFRRLAGPAGRGGGKPHFVTGVLSRDSVQRFFDDLEKELASNTSAHLTR